MCLANVESTVLEYAFANDLLEQNKFHTLQTLYMDAHGYTWVHLHTLGSASLLTYTGGGFCIELMLLLFKWGRIPSNPLISQCQIYEHQH